MIHRTVPVDGLGDKYKHMCNVPDVCMWRLHTSLTVCRGGEVSASSEFDMQTIEINI